ncbi:hypothetical protein ABIA16_003767 [Sinorhizobium fredii]
MATGKDGWTKKRKGTALVYTHLNSHDGRAIVENFKGIYFNGFRYVDLEAAKRAALAGTA